MKREVLPVLLLLVFAFSLLLLSTNVAAAITLTNPEFGASQASTFDITVTTSSAVTCRHSTFQRPFDQMTPFTTTGETQHTAKDYAVPSAGQAYPFYVACSLGSEEATFTLLADTSNPVISLAKAEPAQVVEFPLETTLIVETNENTTCRYDETAEEYDQMGGSFGGGDNDKTSYKNRHEITVQTLQDQKDYTIKVRCRDLANRRSSLATILLKVNTKADPSVINFTPTHNSYLTEGDVKLSIATSKSSLCTFGNQTPPTSNAGSFATTSKFHETQFQVNEGTHTYHFKCLFEGPKELTAQTTFTVDKTKPLLIFVNDDQELEDIPERYSYYTDRLKAEWKAEDNESDIRQYNYSVIAGSQTIVDWQTTTSTKITLRNLELKDGQVYVFRVKAQNNAGTWSDIKDSAGVRIDSSLNIKERCSNRKKDGDETDIDCGGPLCTNQCKVQQGCATNSDCQSNLCSEFKCSAASCTDGVKNNQETDVDCGGPLCTTKCLVSDSCKINSDCQSGICTEGICLSQGACYNNVQDELETDIDCGGICAEAKNKLCSQGKRCGEDSDCATNTCGISGRCVAKGDRDEDKRADNADNCPNASNPMQEDTDKDGLGDACDKDSDNDGLPDEWEQKYNLDVLNPGTGDLDNDNDGLPNSREFTLGTNPHRTDTDGDGHDDAKEVAEGTSPTDYRSHPQENRLGKIFSWLLVALAIGVAGMFLYLRSTKSSTAPQAPPKTPAQINQELREQALREEIEKTTLQRGPQDAGAGDFSPYSVTPRGRDIAPITFPPRRPPRHPGSRMQEEGRGMQPGEHHQRSYPVFDEIRKEHTKLSGEEVFEQLKRHTRRRL